MAEVSIGNAADWKTEQEAQRKKEREFFETVTKPTLERAEAFLSQDKPFHAIALLLSLQVRKEGYT